MFGLKILKTMVDWCLVTTKEKRNNSEQFSSFKVQKKKQSQTKTLMLQNVEGM